MKKFFLGTLICFICLGMFYLGNGKISASSVAAKQEFQVFSGNAHVGAGEGIECSPMLISLQDGDTITIEFKYGYQIGFLSVSKKAGSTTATYAFQSNPLIYYEMKFSVSSNYFHINSSKIFEGSNGASVKINITSIIISIDQSDYSLIDYTGKVVGDYGCSPEFVVLGLSEGWSVATAIRMEGIGKATNLKLPSSSTYTFDITGFYNIRITKNGRNPIDIRFFVDNEAAIIELTDSNGQYYTQGDMLFGVATVTVRHPLEGIQTPQGPYKSISQIICTDANGVTSYYNGDNLAFTCDQFGSYSFIVYAKGGWGSYLDFFVIN